MQEPLPLSAQLEPDGKTKLPVWSAYIVISEGTAISLISPVHRPQRPPGSTRCVTRGSESEGGAASFCLVAGVQANTSLQAQSFALSLQLNLNYLCLITTAEFLLTHLWYQVLFSFLCS